MVDAMFSGMLVDMGVVCGLLKCKASQPQNEGPLRKKVVNRHDKAKGKYVVTKVSVLDWSLEDIPKHLPAGTFAVDLAPCEHHKLDSHSLLQSFDHSGLFERMTSYKILTELWRSRVHVWLLVILLCLLILLGQSYSGWCMGLLLWWTSLLFSNSTSYIVAYCLLTLSLFLLA